MLTPNNIVQQVITYQKSELAYLQNLNCFVATANTKFENFQNLIANLGSTVSFDLPYRFITSNGLTAVWQAIQQRVHNLSVNQSSNTSYTVTDPQRIFSLGKEDYMKKIGRDVIAELASRVEINIALNATSAVVDDNPDSSTYGERDYKSGPYRFFGNGRTSINSYQQLAQMITNFKNYGAVKAGIKVYLPDTIVSPIIGSGLTQFVPRRNDEIAMSWEIGSFGSPPVDYYQSNLLPIHIAGTVGQATSPSNELTVVSTDDPTGNNITQITFSGAGASDPDAIKEGDMFEFVDGVSGQPNMRYLTFIGHVPSDQPVQFRAKADAGSDGAGNVVVNIYPALISASGANQNLNNAIAAGMKCQVMDSHRAGLVVGGNALYLAMPRLPSTDPFPSSSEYDSETGVSMRLNYGSIFGTSNQGFIHAVIWGSTLVPSYSMRILFPL